uniref:ShKT domain-containing protein n=1 Tax=Caenorhabditis tropicalis TaxID=1561998 RepID=A0A1I7U4W0_9PELO
MFSLLLLFAYLHSTEAVIGSDLNCTTYNGTSFVYSPTATICSNVISDSSCAVLYPATATVTAGTDNARPLTCYTTASATPASIVQDMKTAAIADCPATCGYCCETAAYDCANVAYPRLDCSTITSAQCLSATWRTIIAEDCPSACGLCGSNGCVDAVVDCANDPSICTTVGMQDFVNTYCQLTCDRCASSTTASSSGTCTSYAADSSTACADWAANGFCTNTFYTTAQRMEYCATTCKLC